MIISYSHRFVFIHNWKAAGTSVRAALMPFAHEQPTRNRLINLMMDRGSGLGFRLNSLATRSRLTTWLSRIPALAPFDKHNTALALRGQLPSRIWARYFKFGFVRNPWDREVSNYEFTLQRQIQPAFGQIEHLSGFDEYVDKYVRFHAFSQKLFFTDESGEVIVDRVGRFETLAEDFAQICSRIGITAELPHRNPTRRRSYRDYYTPASQRMIAEIYADDIELFNYTF